MALRFVGIDPDTGSANSPTVWVDPETADLVIQGYRVDEATEAECAAFTVPGHAVGIPSNETVIRIPQRMVDIVRKACDAAEAAG